jgi:hypothetical protein
VSGDSQVLGRFTPALLNDIIDFSKLESQTLDLETRTKVLIRALPPWLAAATMA